jgi:hypothetical protein
MFEQVNIISYPRKENKGKTLAVVISILGLVAVCTLVTYEVIKFYKPKKKPGND